MQAGGAQRDGEGERVRTIDCVIVGWRPGKEEGTVGSLILGLYDKRGKLGRSATRRG